MSASRRLDAVHSHLSAAPRPSTRSAMAYKSPVTSHVLDTSRGRPAADMQVELQRYDAASSTWTTLKGARTNSDGRVADALVPEGVAFAPGTYRMLFRTQPYFEAHGVTDYFYPEVTIAFLVKDVTQHYHVPLLINPFGYSTYRGS